MIDTETQQKIQAHRLQQIRRRLREHDYAGVVLFDPINIRYATGSRNMQVWTMHNFCRYAVILEAGGVILFDLPGSMHLSQNLSQITELRPAVSTDYMIVGERSCEMADRWATEIKSVLHESGIQRENIAIDRADLALCLACQKADIHLKDGKSVMEKARAIKSVEEIRALKWSLGGKAALQEIQRQGVKRRSVGLLFSSDVPRLEWSWDLTDPRGNPGEVRWAIYSFALNQYIGIGLVDHEVEIGEMLDIAHPRGSCQAEVTQVPFVDRSS